MNGGNAEEFDGGCRVRRCHLNGKNAGADKQRKIGGKVAEIENQTVPFKIEAFPGGSSLAQGRRKGLFRGILEYLDSKYRRTSRGKWGKKLQKLSFLKLEIMGIS